MAGLPDKCEGLANLRLILYFEVTEMKEIFRIDSDSSLVTLISENFDGRLVLVSISEIENSEEAIPVYSESSFTIDAYYYPWSYHNTTELVNSEKEYYISDHLGNTRITYTPDIIDANNIEYTLRNVFDYFPFGGVLRMFSDGSSEKFLTTQHERDTESGLDHRFARFYDSDLGRFFGVDPLSDKAFSWTPYRYGFNNPVRYIDPSDMYEDDIYYENGKEVKRISNDQPDRHFEVKTQSNGNLEVISELSGRPAEPPQDAASGQEGMPGWASTTNNVLSGIGVGTGLLEGNYGLTANHTFRYAQRINGRVVSAAEITAAHTAQSLKIANSLGRFNVVTGVIGTGYSAAKAYTDYNKGGWNNVNGLDVADAGVGAGGLVVSGLVILGTVSNPFGWGVAIGTGVYFGARLVYDLSIDKK